MMTRLAVSIVAMTLAAGTAQAQQGAEKLKKEIQPTKKVESQPAKADKPAVTLKVGDAAPKLEVTNWIKGSEVPVFEKDHAYVVEFWATWCGPCRESIPHLTKLQKDNKDITFIGVTASERGDDKAKKLEGVQKFVKAQGDGMAYTVAYDETHTMGEKWLAAAGVGTIPTAFIVDGDGKIVFIGNPLNNPEFDKKVEQISKAMHKGEKHDKAKGAAKKSKAPG